MGFFDKVQNSSKGCVGVLTALLNGYQEPEPEPAPELGSEEETETESTPQLLPFYKYENYRIPGNDIQYPIPENDIQYPGEKTIYRLIPANETANEAIAKAKKLLTTTIDGKKVLAFVLFIAGANNDDKRIYLKSTYDNIEQNTTIYNTIVYTFDNIPLPE